MKTKFATYDLCAIIHDLNKLKRMRVANVYDINSKTYLLKLQRPDEKAFILFESGIRIHVTTYDWPKGIIPSGFSMKFRKHIRSKRLTAVSQVGVDRIIDLQFGDAERSAHVIVELYDRGNVILTDHEYTILNILRPRTDHDKDVRFSVRERYPLEQARQAGDFLPTMKNILLFLQNANTGDALKKSLIRHIPFGSLLLDHVFTQMNIPLKSEIGVHIPQNEAGAELVYRALCEAKRVSDEIIEKPNGGFILYEETLNKSKEANGQPSTIQTFKEYYPYDFIQFRKDEGKILEFDTFSEAVDKYYSSIEAQKVNVRIANAEKEGEKKLQNIKKDHEKRLQALAEVKEIQERRGEYVLYNKELVEQAIVMIKRALSNLKNLNKELATKCRAPKAPPKLELGKWLETLAGMGEQAAANSIVKLKLDSNRFTMRLSNPYEESEPPLNVDIDLGLNVDQNARKLFEEKRAAETKKEKTAAATKKALKSALKSARQQAESKLNQAKSQHKNVIRARKTFWFEKFFWFISSDGYLVLGGRDAQQNELLVKRYMRPGDIYVHAEIQGASSIVIRNQKSVENIPPPRTLNEAGTFAVCFSTAWDANVSITAWWVRHDQVSRTAPAGEYLVSGSFMIRGKRNFLPSFPLHLGFGLMFKIDEESVQQHRINDDQPSLGEKTATVEEEMEEADEELENNDEESDLDEEGGEKEDEFPDIKVRVGIDDSKSSEADAKDNTEKDVKENDEEEEKDGDEEEEEEDEAQTNEEQSIIESITANPEAVDELLFALPVVAPYSAMQRFKFKVKVTPGTCKRGKAVKMALDLFSRDKNLSIVEKTLIKSQIGDDRGLQLMPGKVRVSAPMLMNNKYK